MKWIAVSLFVIAALLAVAAVWTRRRARSADERAGADLPLLFAGAILAFDVLLLAGWALFRLFAA